MPLLGHPPVHLSPAAEARCPSPGVPEHGVVGSAGPFSAGDVVEIKCKSRYMIAGEPLLVCQDDGTWSRPLPKCAYQPRA